MSVIAFLSCGPNQINDPVGIDSYTGSLGSTYQGVGLGTKFAVYAPQAGSVYVAGTFNGFSTTANPMQKTLSGVWETVISTAVPGNAYKYYSADFLGQWVQDPYGRSFNGNDNDNTLIINNNYTWNDGSWTRPAKSSLVIYEMHIKDFSRGDSQAAGTNYQGVINKIPYLTDLGINCVEIMPLQEWSGNSYSWGYNSACYFAPENSLSDNKANGKAYQDLKELVDSLHQAGIAVVLDVVYNHTFQDAPMWKIDSASYYDTTVSIPWGEKFDLTKPAALRYVNDNLRFWMDEFHIDGFRFDSTENIDSASLLSVISGLRSDGYNDRYYIFEEFNGTHNSSIRTYNTVAGNQIISSWGTGFKNALWDLINNALSANMGKVTYYSSGDGWNYPAEVINYVSSHDEGTLTGHLNTSALMVRTATVHQLTSLGIPMIWMGEEVLNPSYGNSPPSGGATDEANNIIDWDTYRAAHSDVLGFFSSVIKLRIAHPALHQNVNNPDSNGDSFDWNTDWTSGFVGYTYKGVSGDNDFVILVNYRATSKSYAVAFPRTGTWYLMCDGINATNTLPGLASWTINSTTSNITVGATNALIFMSAAVNP